jgi:hypothetical protein
VEESVSFVAVRQYEVGPSGAERLLRDRSDSQDLAFGLGQLAAVAARKGNIVQALRLLTDLKNVNRGEKNVALAEARATEAVREIAREWTIKNGPRAVLKWARSRPTTEGRTWALIGMAEALGHRGRSSKRRRPLFFRAMVGSTLNNRDGYPLDSGSPYRLWFGSRLRGGWVNDPVMGDRIDGDSLLRQTKETLPRFFDRRRLNRNVNSSR